MNECYAINLCQETEVIPANKLLGSLTEIALLNFFLYDMNIHFLYSILCVCTQCELYVANKLIN